MSKAKVRFSRKPRLAERLLASSGMQFALLAALGFLLYANTLSHGYVLDDVGVIVKNKLTQEGIRGIPGIISHAYYFGYKGESRAYRPLSVITFALEVQLFGNSAAVSHFINVLIYAAVGILLLILLRHLCRISGADDSCRNGLVPLAGALLFLTHPVHTEVVANIKGRDELLCLLGMSAALCLAFRFESSRPARTLILAALCYALALFSKESAITFLPVLVVTLFLARVGLRRAVLQTVVFASLAAGFLVVRVAVLKNLTNTAAPVGGCVTSSLQLALDLPTRWTTAVYVLGKYLKVLFIPHPLAYDYSYNQVPLLQSYDVKALFPLLLYVGLGTYAALRIWKRDLLAYAILFYLVNMSVASNLFYLTGVTMAERLLFTPSFGFCMALALLLGKFAGSSQPVSRYIPALLVGILAAYSFKTIDRNRAWADNLTLCATDAPYTRDSAMARMNFGAAQLERSQRETNAPARRALLLGGIENINAVLAICPETAAARGSLGWAYEELGDTERALEHYELVLSQGPNTSLEEHIAALYFNLGLARRQRGDCAGARAALQRAVAHHPSDKAISALKETIRDPSEPSHPR